MANALFDKVKDAFLGGEISWTADTIRAALCSGKADLAEDEFLADVEVLAISEPLKGKTLSRGVADANNTAFSLGEGCRVAFLAIFQDNGNKSNDRLIVHLDNFGTGKFPFVTTGGDLQIIWDSGPNKIFKL